MCIKEKEGQAIQKVEIIEEESLGDFMHIKQYSQEEIDSIVVEIKVFCNEKNIFYLEDDAP
jgi:hypothetical protein